MDKLYNRTNWVDDNAPDIDADNLNNIEKGIDDIDNRVVEVGNSVEQINSNLSALIDSKNYAIKVENRAFTSSDGEIFDYNTSNIYVLPASHSYHVKYGSTIYRYAYANAYSVNSAIYVCTEVGASEVDIVANNGYKYIVVMTNKTSTYIDAIPKDIVKDIDNVNTSLNALAYGKNAGGKNHLLNKDISYLSAYNSSGWIEDNFICGGATGSWGYVGFAIKNQSDKYVHFELMSSSASYLGEIRYNISSAVSKNFSKIGDIVTFKISSDNGEFLLRTSNESTKSTIKVRVWTSDEENTPYEPYIKSNKQLTHENESLSEQGLLGNTNIEIIQGYPSNTDITQTFNNANYVCSKGYYECSANDTITIHNENSGTIAFYDASKAYISEIAYPCKAPTNAKYFRIKIGYKVNITPSNCGNVSCYINNAIDTLKADLSEFRPYSVHKTSGNSKSITLNIEPSTTLSEIMFFGRAGYQPTKFCYGYINLDSNNAMSIKCLGDETITAERTNNTINITTTNTYASLTFISAHKIS